MDLTADHLAGWTPTEVAQGDGDLLVEWCHTEGMAFTEPFFDQTIRMALADPTRPATRQTDAHRGRGAARRRARAPDRRLRVPPVPLRLDARHADAGRDRPGARALRGRSARHRAAGTVRSDSGLPTTTACGGSGSSTAALSQPRTSTQRHCVVKLDSWTVLDLALVRRAFPSVPWIFLHRDPLDVMVSQHRYAGFHMRPGSLEPAALGFARRLQPPDDRAEYRRARARPPPRRGRRRRRRTSPLRRLRRAARRGRRGDRDRTSACPSTTPTEPRWPRRPRRTPRTRPVVPARSRPRADPIDPRLASAVDRWARPAYDRVRGARSPTGER